MRKLALFLFLIASLPVFGQGVYISGNAFTAAKNGPPGAQAAVLTLPSSTVAICPIANAGGSPCTNYTPLYADAALQTPVANPITTDALGNYGAYAAPGQYIRSITTFAGVYIGDFPFTAGVDTSHIADNANLITIDPSSDIGPAITAAATKFGSTGGTIVITGGTWATAATLQPNILLHVTRPYTHNVSQFLPNNSAVYCDGSVSPITTNLPANNFTGGMFDASNSNTISIVGCNATATVGTAAPALLTAQPVTNLSMSRLNLTNVAVLGVNGAPNSSQHIRLSDIADTFTNGYGNRAAIQLFFAQDVVGTHLDFIGTTHGIQWWGGDSGAQWGGQNGTPDAVNAAGDMSFTGITCSNIGGSCAWGSDGYNITVTGGAADGCGDLCWDSEGGRSNTFTNVSARNYANFCAGVFNQSQDVTFDNLTCDGGSTNYNIEFVLKHAGGTTGPGHDNVKLINSQLTCSTTCEAVYSEGFRHLVIQNDTFRNGTITGINYNYNLDIQNLGMMFTGSDVITAINIPAILGASTVNLNDVRLVKLIPAAGSVGITTSWSDFNYSDFFSFNKLDVRGFSTDLATQNQGQNVGPTTAPRMITSVRNSYFHDNGTTTHDLGPGAGVNDSYNFCGNMQDVAGSRTNLAVPLPDQGACQYAQNSGTTFTGPVILAADPTTASQAATKNYVDTKTAGSGSSGVSSFNTRTGGVTPQSSDYSSFYDASGAAAAATGTAAQKANNLSDLASASTARTNLGLGSAATQASSAFDAAGAAAAQVVQVIVAASNSPNIAAAKYKCTGTNDDVCIQQAINSCPSSTSGVAGCRVLLEDGVYNTTATITIDNDDIEIAGLHHCMWGGYNNSWSSTSKPAGAVGTGCSQIHASGNFNIIQVNHTTNLGTGSGDQNRHRGLRIDKLYLVGTNYQGVAIYDDLAYDDNVFIEDNVIQRTANGIFGVFDSPTIRDNSIQDISGDAINVGGVLLNIYNNLLYDIGGTCIQSFGTGAMIHHNKLGDCTNGVHIFQRSAAGSQTFSTPDHFKVDSNSMVGVRTVWVAVTGARGGVISGNTFDANSSSGSPDTNGTNTGYDVINIAGSPNVVVQGNYADARNGVTMSGFFVNMDSASTSGVVAANTALGAWASGGNPYTIPSGSYLGTNAYAGGFTIPQGALPLTGGTMTGVLNSNGGLVAGGGTPLVTGATAGNYVQVEPSIGNRFGGFLASRPDNTSYLGMDLFTNNNGSLGWSAHMRVNSPDFFIWDHSTNAAAIDVAPGGQVNMPVVITSGGSTAPTGSCSIVGWAFTQDGHASFCNGTTWAQKI